MLHDSELANKEQLLLNSFKSEKLVYEGFSWALYLKDYEKNSIGLQQ